MLKIYRFASEADVAEIASPDLAASLREPGVTWIDLSAPSEDEFHRVAKIFGWHPLAIEDCLIENQLPKVDDYGEYLLLVLHAIDVDHHRFAFASKEIEIFVGPNYLATHHAEETTATAELVTRCRKNPSLAARGPSYVLYLLLQSMSDVYLPYLDRLDQQIQTIEADIAERPGRETVHQITALRRDVIGMRRVVTPQIEVLRRLSREEFGVVPREATVYFRDIYDDLFRITLAADSYRELLSGALESYRSAVSNEMNQVMKVLTVFASFFIPLTFMAGVWGMNFRFMPELDWRYGYPLALGVMALVSLGLAWFFRSRRWW